MLFISVFQSKSFNGVQKWPKYYVIRATILPGLSQDTRPLMYHGLWWWCIGALRDRQCWITKCSNPKIIALRRRRKRNTINLVVTLQGSGMSEMNQVKFKPQIHINSTAEREVKHWFTNGKSSPQSAFCFLLWLMSSSWITPNRGPENNERWGWEVVEWLVCRYLYELK